MNKPAFFEIIAKEKHARKGIFKYKGIEIETPVFMPCGTKGSVKTLEPHELKELGIKIILANTYHLHLRPGEKIIKKMGGLHEWINWEGLILTDSGGYQVFSLGKLNKIDDHGVTFRSHLDGKLIKMTPKKAVQIQQKLGSDIIMAFDECAPADSDYTYAKKAMERTHKWLTICVKEYEKNKDTQLLFPIIQGTIYKDLRKESTKFCSKYAQNGIAIGGLSVGEKREKMYEILDEIKDILPQEIPHYLMGVGHPIDILNGVERGIDFFDCVMPTRLARHGAYFDKFGRHNIKIEKNKIDKNPLDKDCSCPCCLQFTKSYLRHLFIENEILALKMLSIHNLYFLMQLMEKIREAIKKQKFHEFKKEFLQYFKD